MVGGASLIRRNVMILESVGVEKVVVVVGYRGAFLQEMVLEQTVGLDIELVFAVNHEYDKSNGISVLAAEPHTDGNFLLLMADHVFDREIVVQAQQISVPVDGGVLCVDYKISQVFDIEDATKVATDGRFIYDIGKQIETYNAIDTGIFAFSPGVYDALRAARARSTRDDCSLSEGVQTLIGRRLMLVEDIGDALWQDVDTELCLKHVERLMRDHRIDADASPRRMVAAG
jgi:choline kinase